MRITAPSRSLALTTGSALLSCLDGALHPKFASNIVDGHDRSFFNPELLSHPGKNLDLQKVALDAADALRAICEFSTADSERDLKHKLAVDLFERTFDRNFARHVFFAER